MGAACKIWVVGHYNHSVVATEELKSLHAQMNMIGKKPRM